MEVSQPFFSIVIPTYNRADLILNTLETVFNQTYQNFEILVVDNCSTDNTQEVLTPYVTAGRLKFIRHDKNYERSKSRNTGMEHAKGDFLTFLDSDDFMYPDNLKDAADFISKNPTTYVFQNLYELVNSEKKLIYTYKFPSIENQYKALCEGNFMSCIGGFIHKKVYQKYKFDLNPKLIGSEDYEFWFRVFAEFKVGRIQKVNSGILEHTGRSVNNNVYSELEYQLSYIINVIVSDKNLIKLFGPHLDLLKSTFYFKLAMISSSAKKNKKALWYLRKAVKLNPSILSSKKILSFCKSIIF